MYKRNAVPAIQGGSGLLTVEQARKRNAELHMELRHLEAAADALNERVAIARRTLDDQLDEAKAELSKARDRLTSVIKATDAARAQAANIAAASAFISRLPEPKYGGRAGLEAATRELAEHEAKKKLAPVHPAEPRPKASERHGTIGRYIAGCRCIACRTLKATYDATHRPRRKQAA